jgi:hypothetical protein
MSFRGIIGVTEEVVLISCSPSAWVFDLGNKREYGWDIWNGNIGCSIIQ